MKTGIKAIMLRYALTMAVVMIIISAADAFETITFPSTDQLTITADLYMPHSSAAPFIVLFHQAGYSRGEYLEIAPKLNDIGFNAMAVDQRSGEEVHGIVNETAKLAIERGLGTTFTDALPDLLAAIAYAKSNFAKGKLLIWGSSYSAALVLKIAGDTPDIADGLLAFSPGEYFVYLGMSETYISDSAKNITMPVFITSALNEKDTWQPLFDIIPSSEKTSFLPSTGGVHGSSTLLEETPENQEYWTALKVYLNQFTSESSNPATGMIPDIKVNDSDGPLTILATESASITIGLQTSESDASEKDWWVMANTPFGSFFWIYPGGWQAVETRAVLFPAIGITSFPIPPSMILPAGNYTFTFSIDDNSDGIRDNAYSDSVELIVE